MQAAGQTVIPRIAEQLKDQNLLVTGATGLLAKVFVEKLLRSVPSVGQVYLLIRSRPDGMSSEHRLATDILGSSAFDRLRALLGPRFDPLCAQKLRAVDGDLTHEGLGLSAPDRDRLTREVNIVVNSAAAVTFDERLDVALQLNALGPTRLMELAQQCNRARFMQVSTCYVSGRRKGDVAEALADPSEGALEDLDGVISEMAETCERIKGQAHLDGEQVHRQLVEAGMAFAHRYGWNDTYTFTKWIGEQLVNRRRGEMPTVILRPAIIESSLEEPMPGWIDGLRMADPMIMAFGRGKLDQFPADPEVAIDLIPVDHVANGMIATLPPPGAEPGLQIYQAASSHRTPLRLADLVDYLQEGFRHCPALDDAGRPVRCGSFTLVKREAFMDHWNRRLNRALRLKKLLEALDLAPGRRRRLAAAVSQIEQVIYFAKIYAPYTHLKCRYRDHRLRDVAESLHPEDQQQFPFAAADIDWSDYVVRRHIPGLHRYALGGQKAGALPSEPAPLEDARIAEAREEATTLWQVFEGVARIVPDKVMLQMNHDGRWIRYTYAEAWMATASIARRFEELGLKPGERIAICGENMPQWGLTYLAAMRSGCTALPLDPQLPPAEVLACAGFAHAGLICAGPDTFEALTVALEETTQEAAPWTGPILQMDAALVPPPGASRDPGPQQAAARDDDIASILFTSGTTVAPKAVQLSHANLLSNAKALLRVHPLRSPQSFVSVLPMYHAFEFTAGFVVPICLGATVTYVEQLKGPQVMAAMRSAGATIMLTVPRLLKLFHDGIQQKVRAAGPLVRGAFRLCGALSTLTGGRAGKILFASVHRQFGGRLRTFISGGSALDPELHAAFTRLGFRVYEGYGLTETAPVLTVNPPGRSKAGSVGPALPGIDLQIRNANQEGIGELWARGNNIMPGYLDNQAATAEVLHAGWFRTGDLGREDADGYIYITGRLKDMVVTEAGKNVYPDEVESRYKELPYLKELCVLGVPNPTGPGESVHAVIVPDYEKAAGLDRSTVQRIIREAAARISEDIPQHQRVAELVFWNVELPKTSTLKAKRGVIREKLAGGDAATAHDAGTATARTAKPAADGRRLSAGQRFIRKTLAQLTRKKEAHITPECNLLLDLGVDSLMKLQLISELEGHFDLQCTNEQAAALARVSDVYVLVGDRRLRKGKAPSRSWKERQGAGELQHTDGAPSTVLLPARWLARGGMGLLLRSYIRVQAGGQQHIPEEGPFILAPNHCSHLDAVSVLTALRGRRRLWVAGAQDYFFSNPLKGWLFGRVLDTIPFDRFSEGYEGLSRCLEKLEQGDGVLFFPEGTRSMNGRMSEFKTGVALMAIESGAPVIPALIENAFNLLPKGSRLARPGVIRVTFDHPMEPSAWRCPDDLGRQYLLYRELTCAIQQRVQELGGQMADAQESN